MSSDDDLYRNASSASASDGVIRTGDATIPERLVAAAYRAKPHARPRRPRDLAEALVTLGRVFDNLETMQLQCSVLQAEKSQSQSATEKIIDGAFARIEDLEAVVAGLMRIVAKYDSLLSQSNGRRKEAEQRAAHAEVRVKETERGASEAVEWLYRYMADSLHSSR